MEGDWRSHIGSLPPVLDNDGDSHTRVVGRREADEPGMRRKAVMGRGSTGLAGHLYPSELRLEAGPTSDRQDHRLRGVGGCGAPHRHGERAAEFVADAPYQLAIVSLDSGGRLTARIAGERVKIGDKVELVETRDGVEYFKKK